MIIRAIETCFNQAKQKNWAKTYWCFDIHGTILKPTHQKNNIATEFYPGALTVLQYLSTRTDIVCILYTCSYPHEIKQYLEFFQKHKINFQYVNENPEITESAYGYFEDKLYFNVLLDDKAGFDGELDWFSIGELLKLKMKA